MPLAEARAICPARVFAFDADKSRQALELLAKWCLRFSPVVSVDPACSCNDPAVPHHDSPDSLLLDVTGEDHLFGSEHLLLAEITARLHRMGFAARLAVAPTVGAAWALAHYGPHAPAILREAEMHKGLAPLPVAALRISHDQCAALREVSIERIEHLLVLPRESLFARYGRDLLLRLDQAFGRSDEFIEPLRPLDPLTVARVFDGAAIQLEAIFLTVRDLLGQLGRLLLEKESGVRGLRIELVRINAPPVSRELIVGRATRDENHLWKLLHSRIETMHLGYGVEAVRLTAFWTEAVPHRQIGQWETGEGDAHEEAFEAMLDTIIERWGPRRVLAPRAAASHTPEVARGFEPLRHDDAGHLPPEALRLVDRPSLLLERPEPADAVALLPDRPPSYLRWRGEGYTLRSGIGPERIVTAWWGDRRASTRDYFKVESTAGAWLWAFRELESGRWFIHGLWA